MEYNIRRLWTKKKKKTDNRPAYAKERMLIKSWNFSVRFVNGARNSYLDEKIFSFSPTSRCTPNNAAGDLQKEENLRVQEGG